MTCSLHEIANMLLIVLPFLSSSYLLFLAIICVFVRVVYLALKISLPLSTGITACMIKKYNSTSDTTSFPKVSNTRIDLSHCSKKPLNQKRRKKEKKRIKKKREIKQIHSISFITILFHNLYPFLLDYFSKSNRIIYHQYKNKNQIKRGIKSHFFYFFSFYKLV